MNKGGINKMNIDNKKPLEDYIFRDDIVGAMRYLKECYGVSESFICNKANVKQSTYNLFKNEKIKELGTDKREALINTVKEMYL